jgi:hypothetical protein
MTCTPDAIELAVYSCFEDTLLFVPAACLPPREAERVFGPLAHIGTVSAALPDGSWESILTQIERHLFATVPRPQGEMLVGDGFVAAARLAT